MRPDVVVLRDDAEAKRRGFRDRLETLFRSRRKRHDLSRAPSRLRTVFNPTTDLQMFWIFLSVLGFASILFKLGAMSVSVSVMSIVIMLLVVIAVVLLGVVVWQRLVRH